MIKKNVVDSILLIPSHIIFTSVFKLSLIRYIFILLYSDFHKALLGWGICLLSPFELRILKEGISVLFFLIYLNRE